MKGKKKRQGSGSGKTKLESQPKQTSKSMNKKQQNQNTSSNVYAESTKKYDSWHESNPVALKSNGWGSNGQNWKMQNGSNRFRSTASSNILWDDREDHFPRLGAEAPPPKVNVWEERKFKAAAVKALEPQNEYDEEAMLKKALELSLMVAKEEEEIRRKEEETYLMHMEAMKIEEEQDNFSIPSAISPLSSRSESESPIIYHSVKEEYSSNTNSNNRNISDFSKQEKVLNFNKQEKAFNFSKQEKVFNSGGARPKISKVIDRFGGWGLSEKDKKTMHSDERRKPQKLADLVDNILEDDKSPTKPKPCNDHAIKKKDIKKGQDLYSKETWDPWCSDETDNNKKIVSNSSTSNNDEILFDGKDTFADEEDKSPTKSKPCNDHVIKKKDIKMGQDLYSKEAWDPWCSDGTDNNKKIVSVSSTLNDDEILFDGKDTFADSGVENDLVCADSMEKSKYTVPYDTSMTRIENLQDTEIKCSAETQAQINKKNVDLGHTTGFSSKESVNYHKTDLKEQNKSTTNNSYNLFENTYKYVANDSVADDSLQSSGYETFNTPNGDPWADSQPKISVNTEPFSDKASYENSEHKHETESAEFNNFIGSNIHTLENFGSHSNIEPPNALHSELSASDMNTMHHETFANETPADDVESHILPPQHAHTVPQFPLNPFLSNPLFASNPMFPGSMNFSPMFGYVMDPIMMRQMLMLSTPYFASQLLTMEQYYRSMGMQTDVFSFQPQVIPNLAPPAGVLGSPSEQSAVPNVMNTDVPINTCDPEFQNHLLTDQSRSMPETTNYETSVGKNIKPPGLDISIAQPDNSSTNQNEDDNDCWFKNYLCTDDTLPIPPPKPAASNVDECNSSITIPKSLEPNQNSFSFDSVQPSVSKMDEVSCKDVSSSQEIKVESSKSLSAIEACVTKTVVQGWSDSEDESTESIKPKNTYSWDDTYGWGDDNLPAKSVKNSAVYDDRRRPAYRQPASQPQVSRFQRSKMYK